jgi:hypothetical protein
MDHEGIPGGTRLVTGGTGEAQATDVFRLHVILHMRNLLRVITAFSALPATRIVFEHEAAHKDVQAFQSLCVGSF